jgi:alpha,alpha-trehalase
LPLLQFVEEHFEAEGTELETWLPEDWTPEPEFISQMRKPALKGLARRINRLWKDLSRKIKDEVKENPSLYSIIYVPNGFIVPGGNQLHCFVDSHCVSVV